VKNALEWVKTHWLIVTSGVVMVAAPPGMIYASMMMNESLVKSVAAKVDEADKEIGAAGSARNVNYSIPAAKSGATGFTFGAAPNQSLIDFFKAKRDEQAAQLAKIAEAAVKFNRGTKAPLVAGLFPQPAADARIIKPNDFQRAYLTDAHPELLKRLKAGPTVDPANLSVDLNQRRVNVIREVTGIERPDANIQLPAEQDQMVRERQAEYRLSVYKRQAQSLSFFIDGPSTLDLPPYNPDVSAPDLRSCWDWQWQYWIREDILSAASRANARRADLGVPGSVVKRVVSLRVGPMPSVNYDPSNPGPTSPPPEAAVAPDYRESLTGRHFAPGANGYYDVRFANLEVVLAARDIPQFLNALAEQNFMTVIDLDLRRVDVAEDLRQGFYYGPEPVVRATMRIETLWLREWTKDLMPLDYRKELGIPDPPPPAPDPNAPPAEGAGPA
jgi:hypothetical protein